MADKAQEAHRSRTLRVSPGTSDRAVTLAGALRRRLLGQTWNAVRKLCETGKVRVNGERVTNPAARIDPDAELTIDMNAPRPRTGTPGFRVVFEDRHLIVIEKPAGTSSVPYERKEVGTALDLIRDHWRAGGRHATATPLYAVHRLDKETSGLLCFAKTRLAARGLHQVFQRHLATRTYVAVAHGAVAPGRIESRLISDRGDGLRGSTRDPNQGQQAVTHIEVLQLLPDATVCQVRLETGRTHQIRIHLAERGHPVVGDSVYTRDLRDAGAPVLLAARMMLHAATLGFDHPITGERLDFATEPPPAFTEILARLAHRGSPS